MLESFVVFPAKTMFTQCYLTNDQRLWLRISSQKLLIALLSKSKEENFAVMEMNPKLQYNVEHY